MNRETAELRQAFALAKKRSELARESEMTRVAKGKSPWPVYHASIELLERAFYPLLPDLNRFINQRRQEKGKIFVLNAMGPLGLFTPGEVDGEVAITLKDWRADSEKAKDPSHNRLVIEDHILSGGTMHQLRTYLATHDDTELPGFDLIVCKPDDGGWRTLRGLPGNRASRNSDVLEWALLQRLHSVQSQGGELLLAAPRSRDRIRHARRVDKLIDHPGIAVQKTEYDFDNALRITKTGQKTRPLPSMVISQ